eukprot:1280393-Rhodomonas_salina.1
MNCHSQFMNCRCMQMDSPWTDAQTDSPCADAQTDSPCTDAETDSPCTDAACRRTFHGLTLRVDGHSMD